jgi:hypothetical protein
MKAALCRALRATASCSVGLLVGLPAPILLAQSREGEPTREARADTAQSEPRPPRFTTGQPSADESRILELIGDHGLEAWREPTGEWIVGRDAQLAGENPKKLAARPGKGVLINGATGKTSNLVTKQDFADIEAHFEFLIPKGSNSGVKFEGLYEIQIIDSFGIAKPKAIHCGGIYPRAELLPRYHYLDDGISPRTNAARPSGLWQTLDVIFRAPRFGPDGHKIKNARIEKAVLNGQLIHQDVELATPTGHAWRQQEVARGPILLQADHGPVAFRNIRVRPI